MAVLNVVRFIFGIFGNATALFLFLSPVVTFWRITRSKSTEDFSGVPYVATTLNCLLSTWYGLPFVSPHNLLVSTINGAGAVIETVYVIIFLIYAPKKVKVKTAVLAVAAATIFATVVLVSLLALRGNPRKVFCGLAALIFSICMYASPLTIMRMVIRTKSVEFMPFLLSLFVFLCGTSWFIYGLLGRDPFVYVQNGLGSLLGAIQLILYAIYRKSKGDGKGSKKGELQEANNDKEGSAVDDDSIEMGYANKPPKVGLPQATNQNKVPNAANHLEDRV